jgi:DNA-binding transcriptional LysR family regulator
VNLTALQTFISVVDTGSFTNAARAREMTQPTVTNHIRSLEAQLGETLLDRAHHKVTLTPAGEAVLPHARAILAHLDEMSAELHAQSGQISGPLHIAASTIPGTYLLPRIAAAFKSEYPQVKVAIDITDSTRATEAVSVGDAQVGVTGVALPTAHVDFRSFGRDTLIVIAAPQNPLATHGDLSYSDLADQQWILRPPRSGTRRIIEKMLRTEGVRRDVFDDALVLGNDEAIINAVEADLGIAMMSTLVAGKALESGTVARLALKGGDLSRSFYLALPTHGLSRAADAFVAFAEQHKPEDAR